MQIIPIDVFSLEYETSQQVLVGRWLRDTPDDDLYPMYEQLVAAAKAHGNCRFWLLDMRRRSWHSATFAAWFVKFLSQQVTQELGKPIFVAYVADETHRTDIESVATESMLRQSAQVEFYPYFFNNEAAAREWLLYYQTHPRQLPATRQA